MSDSINMKLHGSLRRIRHGLSIARLWREYDLPYWQMISALGYPIPSRVEERWPHEMNAGNPYKCGICSARREHPGLHVQCDIQHFRKALVGSDLEEFERRLKLAVDAA